VEKRARFQQLSLYIKTRVLREGKTIFCKDEGLLYDLSFSTIREFEYFKPRYLSYLEDVLHTDKNRILSKLDDWPFFINPTQTENAEHFKKGF